MRTIERKFQELARKRDGETIVLKFSYGDRDPVNFGPAYQEYLRLAAMQDTHSEPPGTQVVADEMVSERYHFRYLNEDGKPIPDMVWPSCVSLRLSSDPSDKPRLIRPDNYTVTVDGVEIGTFPGGAELLYQPIPDGLIQAWLAAAKPENPITE